MIYKNQARIESSADMLIFGENVQNQSKKWKIIITCHRKFISLHHKINIYLLTKKFRLCQKLHQE